MTYIDPETEPSTFFGANFSISSTILSDLKFDEGDDVVSQVNTWKKLKR